MSQLEQILNHITGEASAEAAALQRKGEEEAAAILSQYQSKAEKEVKEILSRAKTESDHILERAKSAAALNERQLLLKTRQEILSKVTNKALEEMRALPDDAYFSLLLVLAKNYAFPEAGEMILSPEDKKRLPLDFSERLREALSEKEGASLTISEKTANTGGGFVLAYGNIEENCTFGALFEEKADLLSDAAYQVLFG